MSADAVAHVSERLARAAEHARTGSFFRAGLALGELRKGLQNYPECPECKRAYALAAALTVACMRLEMER